MEAKTQKTLFTLAKIVGFGLVPYTAEIIKTTVEQKLKEANAQLGK